MPNANHRVESALESLKKDFIVVGKTRVRSWHAWLAIGLAAGVLFVANRSGEFEAGSAQTVTPPFIKSPAKYVLTLLHPRMVILI